MTQTEIPQTKREPNTRAEHISEQLREQLVQNANGRAREKELRKQLLSELIGTNPEAKDLLEQLLALLDERPPAYRYVDGKGIGIESVLNFKLEAVVHPTGEVQSEEPKAPPKKVATKKPESDGKFDEDSIPDPDEAAAAQLDNNVEESDDGDVVVPDKAAKKSKAKAKKPARRKK